MERPFTAGGIVRPPYFIGRDAELARTVQSLGTMTEHLVIMGQRRMGKSSLLANASDQIERRYKGVRTLQVDCRRVTDAMSFLDAIVDATLKAHRKKRPVAGWMLLKARLLTGSVIDMLPRVSRIGGSVGAVFTAYLEFRERGADPERLVDKAFTFLQEFSKEHAVSHVLILDEFQELDRLKLPYIFEAFKSHGDQMTHVRFAFSGSSLGVLESIFLKPRSPLYMMTGRIQLEPLDDEATTAFAIERFGASGFTIDSTAAGLFHRLTGGIPYYVQRLGSSTWQAAVVADRKDIDDDLVQRAYHDLLDDLSPEFETRWEHRFGPQQRAILLGLAKENRRSRTNLADAIGRPSGQLSAALGMLAAAMEIRKTERGVYEIGDPVFAAWLRGRLADG